MRISAAQREKLGHIPPTAACQKAVREYIALAGMSLAEFAGYIGYAGTSVRLWLDGTYRKIAESDLLIRAAAWDYVEANPLRDFRRAGRLFHTENYRRIRRYFTAAVERGEVCLLYGPPGTQKTFVLEGLIAEARKGGSRVAYAYATDRMRPRPLLKRIAAAAGIVVNAFALDLTLGSVVRFYRAGQGAVVIDEAQHLDVHALEILRELHDRSGCGLVLAGSHTLYENFLRGRQHLEQWLSRIDHKDPLPGLQEDEVAEIAARELGNGQPAKLSEKRVRALVAACQVDDVFSRNAAGRPAIRKYLSVRRLVKVLAQLKTEGKEHAA